MIVFPNAKINLGLWITEKRKDNYHNIESIFYPISLCDILEVTENKCFKINNTGLIIDGDINSNLCVKAYNLLRKEHNLPPVSIHLHKIIPFGAGLGGGSSDAAFLLSALNAYFKLNISKQSLQKKALNIGSDCPFFINNKPVIASGRGEIFKEINPKLKGYHIVLIKPQLNVSTSEAYSMIIPRKRAELIETIYDLPVAEWQNKLTNDFESSVFQKYPEIANIKKALLKHNAIYASMSGSGSAVFGIFENIPKIPHDKFLNYFIWKGIL